MPKIPKKPQEQGPSVRLALGADIVKTVGDKALGPAVRLATTIHSGALSPEQFEKAYAAPNVRLALKSNQGGKSDGNAKGFSAPRLVPEIRLAHGPGAQGDNVLIGQRGVQAMPDDKLPALLVSYYYLPLFLENRHRYHYRDWVMDSGAFSAHNSGAEINLQDYIDCCKRLMEEDQSLVEIYALDVIGDWKGSLRNAEEMWRQGVPAIPCFHADEPWDVLKGLAKDYPKIALGGVALAKTGKKMKWAQQCFARIWPKKIHGFAFCSETAILSLPFHSVDATSWEIGPCLTGDTLISTPTGLRPIDSLVAWGKGLQVNIYQGASVSNCQAVYSGEKPVLSLTLKTGQVLRCTHDHKILTDDGWRSASNLRVGDEVRIADKQLRTPVMAEALQDEMLGWMVGDGWHTQEHSIGILFSEDDQEAMEKLLPAWDAFVGRNYALTVQGKMRKKVCENQLILDKFRTLGFRPARAPQKELPDYIFTAKSHQQLAFLRGLFSADGTVKLKGRQACQVILASNSRKMLAQVQLLLIDYGIQSHINWTHPPDKENDQGQLLISGLSALRYIRIIGFNLQAKTCKFRMGNWRHKQKQYSPVMQVEEVGIERVYDILMPSVHHFIANGMIVHNCKYGQWRAFGGQRVSVRGSKQNLRVEVEWYLELERKARVKWKKEMEKLEEIAPTERLVAANDAGQGGARVLARALGNEDSTTPGQQLVRAPRVPTIRLAEGGGGGRIQAKERAFSEDQQ